MPFFRTALVLALPLVAATTLTAPAYADVKAGVDAWQRGDYQGAVAEWRPLALAGDPDAQFNLGQAYKLGRGVPADLTQAEAWYRRAAKQGHLQAEDNLGLVLFTANRREEAMLYIARSAARGEPRAQYVLGTAHFNGDLAPQDFPRAYALTKRASDAGLEIAAARLAQLDRLIPLEQRQRGLALLPEMEKEEQRARLAAVNAALPPAAPPAPSPVKAASVPASAPGTSYAPPPVIAAAPTPAPTPKPAKPAAQAATAAAVEATAAAEAATAAAKPVQVAAAPASQPGTSYKAPPEKGPVKPAADPAPKPAAALAKADPAKPAAATPKPAATGTSPWRAQLGAFGVEANARNLWSGLAKKHSAVAARQPHFVKGPKVTRLQAGGFANKAAAESFCATLRKGGQACLVVDR